MQIYIYMNLLTGSYEASAYNFWHSRESKKTGRFQSDYASYQLLQTLEVDPPAFDFVPGKIEALEAKLKKDIADTHIRQQNLYSQIQELKCLTHQPDIDASLAQPPFGADPYDGIPY